MSGSRDVSELQRRQRQQQQAATAAAAAGAALAQHQRPPFPPLQPPPEHLQPPAPTPPPPPHPPPAAAPPFHLPASAAVGSTPPVSWQLLGDEGVEYPAFALSSASSASRSPPQAMDVFSSSPPYRPPSPSPASSHSPLSVMPATGISEAAWLQLRPALPLTLPPPPLAASAFPSGLPSLPSTAGLSRSASSQLSASATTAIASSAAHQVQAQHQQQHQHQYAALSPQQPLHRFGLQLHQPPSAAPLASPALPSLRLPPSASSSLMSSAAASTAASAAYSALPPFHPAASASSVSSSSSSSFSVQHHIPACSVSLDGCITEANAAFLSTFGFPASLSSLSSSPPSVYTIIHPAEHLSFMLMCRRITTGRCRSLAKERLCCSRDGQRVQRMWIMMSAVTVDERLLTLYCCFLPKPRREDEEEEEREREELRLELEGRAQLQQTQAELQEEMSRIERLYQQQFAALSRQQEKYGVTQQMIAHYSQQQQQQTTQQQQGAASSSPSSASSSVSPPQPRDPARLSLSGLPKPQQLQLHALYHTNEELKARQHQHRQKLGHFMQLLARQAPFQAALSASSLRAAAAAGEGGGHRAHTAPSFGTADSNAMMEDEGAGRAGAGGGAGPAAAGLSVEDVSVPGRSRSPQSALSSSSSQSQSRPPFGRVFSSSVASTSQESPSPFSSEPAPSSRSSSATVASFSSSSSSIL